MDTPLSQIVEDWYKNSPDWPNVPTPTDYGAEARAFLEDSGRWPIEDVKAEIRHFWESR